MTPYLPTAGQRLESDDEVFVVFQLGWSTDELYAESSLWDLKGSVNDPEVTYKSVGYSSGYSEVSWTKVAMPEARDALDLSVTVPKGSFASGDYAVMESGTIGTTINLAS